VTMYAGGRVLVIKGPSTGTVVRLEHMTHAPPGCDGCGVHMLQPRGPIWRVSEWLEWDVERPCGLGMRRYRLMTAPAHALLPIFE
jgi:hypothetical protein